jgi:hypothetical protein
MTGKYEAGLGQREANHVALSPLSFIRGDQPNAFFTAVIIGTYHLVTPDTRVRHDPPQLPGQAQGRRDHQ